MPRPEPRRVVAALALSFSCLALTQVVGVGRASDGAEDGRGYTDIIVALRTHGMDAQGHPALSFVEWQNPDPRSASLRYPARLDWSSPLEAVAALERRSRLSRRSSGGPRRRSRSSIRGRRRLVWQRRWQSRSPAGAATRDRLDPVA